jgi:hypothetical protein
MLPEDKCQPGPSSGRKLPDMAVCRAMQAGVYDLAYCLVPGPHGCEHAEKYASEIYCFHPNRADIIARTAAKKHPGKD